MKSAVRICTSCAMGVCADCNVTLRRDVDERVKCPNCGQGTGIGSCVTCGAEHCRHNPVSHHRRNTTKRRAEHRVAA